jgi:hypothetical protein
MAKEFIRHAQKEEFVSTTSDREITKLLLKGCNCDNCSHFKPFKESEHIDLVWCPVTKDRPGKKVCTKWDPKKHPLEEFATFANQTYPNTISDIIASIQPLENNIEGKKFNLIFKLLNQYTKGKK